ncbi:CU044_5270 family protein [Streptomyces sp. NPDC002643]
MNPAEREELARLLPSPGDPVLPGDRLLRLEGHLMREITGDESALRTDFVTEYTEDTEDTEDMKTGAEEPDLVDQSIEIGGWPGAEGRRRPGWTRRRWALVAVPLTAAAAVVATTVVMVAGPERASTDAEAVRLLERIAAASTAQATAAIEVRDDQFIYTRVQGRVRESDGDYLYTETRWMSVNGKRNGLAKTDWLMGQPRPDGMSKEDFEKWSKVPNKDMVIYPDSNTTTFRELEALPTDPEALYEKAWAATEGQGPTHEDAVLEYFGTMLEEATLLPELNRAIWLSIAKIPGVSVVDKARDISGREGIGLTFGEGDDRAVWIFDRKSLKYLGTEDTALNAVRVVDKVGETPKGLEEGQWPEED